ncbi:MULTISPECIES: hypothetical protein [unclassified Streptomyces]|uniref:hypothetical protein n=1 Tax=unclassified Streptomyces TaxID=2593676 RepID=UPI000DBA5594|nr:hypothetical protein [Streptomyces sp. PsTaAH-137]MYT73219.1 hypothetical protein [Streptomyces sp. SID8367]RAJ74818.1 hypothetical protein K377_06585 [Streptomyces sp. PsTaAH-137]
MLSLRLARGAHPLVQLRRLLVAAASGGTGFLLLCTLGYAMGHPDASGGSLLRLAWCAIPLAATVYFAVAVARSDPGTKPRSGLSAVGLGPARLTLLSAISTAIACTLGSMLALLFFLHLRGDLSGLPFDGAARDLLAASKPLPLAAALTLLTFVPVAASAASAVVLRPRPRKAGEAEEEQREPSPAPTGLPWGIALLAAGLAVETYASHARGDRGFPMPGGLGGSSSGVLAGWALTALGLALAGPALTYHCGRALQAVRPGAVRLLAGRVLQEEARRIGAPIGVLCAVASGTYAAVALYAGRGPDLGPLSTLGSVLVVGCAVATLATASVEARQARKDTHSALLRLGAPATMLRGAVALRAGALFALFVPLTWAVAELSAIPLLPR